MSPSALFSTTTANALPLHVLQGDIKSTLDANMFGNLLLGLYTLIYIGTMYVCSTTVSKKTPTEGKPRIVLTSITLLYFICVGDTALHWYLLDVYFVRSDVSRASIFVNLVVPPGWAHLADNVFAFISIMVADGLMIWRCFYVWEQRLLVIAIPILLFIAETGVFFASIVYISILHAKPTRPQGLTIDNIESAGYFLSAATSLLATGLIAYRIHSVVSEGSSGRRRLRHVIEIVVQSALVYSLSLLLQGIAVIIPFNYSNTNIYALGNFSKVLLTYISGIAPTIMVARVYLSADSTTEMTTFEKMSNIQFVKPNTVRSHITGSTSTNVDSFPTMEFIRGEKYEKDA